MQSCYQFADLLELQITGESHHSNELHLLDCCGRASTDN